MIHPYSRRFVAAGVFVALAAVAPAAEEISSQERAKLIQYLTTMRDQVISESAELSEPQWNFKPGPDRWSVGEVVEHLALTENFLMEIQKKTLAGTAATPEQRAGATAKDEMILKAIPDRTKKVQAPEPIRPLHKLGSQREVLKTFQERRNNTLAYAGKTTDDLRGKVSDSPLGAIDAYQWLLYIGAHTERHLGQIREVKASAQFPKK